MVGVTLIHDTSRNRVHISPIMFLKENINTFKRVCHASNFLGSVLVCWDSSQGKLLPAKYLKKCVKQHKTKCKLLILMQFLLMYGYYTNPLSESWADTGLFTLMFVGTTGSYFGSVSMRRNVNPTCLFINGLLNYLRKWNIYLSVIKSDFFSSISLHVAKFGLVSVLAIPPAFVLLLHWPNPCKPAIAAFWLIPQCRAQHNLMGYKISILSEVVKALVLLVNYLSLTFAINVWLLVYPGLLLMCPNWFRNGLKM